MHKKLCFLLYLAAGAAFTSCSVQKKIGKEANADIFSKADFAPAHIGISIYDPLTQQYLYDYQGDKFFVPASNTKLLTCYVAMRTLGDSLLSFRYKEKGEGIEIEANGDASLLHADFKDQHAFEFLKKQKKIYLTDANWKDNGFGMGWAWDDYNSDYMAERSAMPVYGNTVKFKYTNQLTTIPAYFQSSLQKAAAEKNGSFVIRRDYGNDQFTVRASNNKFTAAEIPFYTDGIRAASMLLADTLKSKVEITHEKFERAGARNIYSQSTDTLLKIMMHRSDNFFAEQTLLMVSNERLGLMSDSRIIDTLLKTDLSGLPQKPKWVDGSGLSRYNLVSPRDFIWVLTQMKNEFKWERIKTILPTGGEGTLSGSYKQYSGRIYAKTGTLSNHVALSGYLITKKGRDLVFSVLVNAHLTSASNIRKGVEAFLSSIIEKY